LPVAIEKSVGHGCHRFKHYEPLRI
jgi:hypothetical protein